MAGSSIRACPLRGRVDPRLVRFTAGATAGVLAVAVGLVEAARPVALGLLASQVAVFAFTAFVSFQWSVWAQVFARFVWPRIDPPRELEDARPARFAQLLALVLTVPALVAFLVGADVAGYGLTAVTLGVSALHAATGRCPGCRAYLLVRRRPLSGTAVPGTTERR